MTDQNVEYRGAALQSFILALGHSEQTVNKVLADAGVDEIDPDRWYDAKWAVDIYYKIGAEIGRSALIAVGRKMVEAAPYPPGIDSIPALLSSLDEAFRLNIRGGDPGKIDCTLEDEHSAVLEWNIKGPCALNIGILEGSCARFGAEALVEHGGGGCMDEGADACVYRVSW